jgi:hypothetical protein
MPELRNGFPGSFYAICAACGSSTGGETVAGVQGSDWSERGAIREWNRVQKILVE